MTLKARARAKLNLWLEITGKREDGYHILDSLVAFTDMGDEIEISAADTLTLTHDGPFSHALPNNPNENLAYKVATHLQRTYTITTGAHIHIHKQLPVAAGIGGGSSNAATTALLLNQLWQLDLSFSELKTMLLPFGADIPVCLHQAPMHMQGIGEMLSPASLPSMHALLVNPGVAVSTKAVFESLHSTSSRHPVVYPRDLPARTRHMAGDSMDEPWNDETKNKSENNTSLAHIITRENHLQQAAIAQAPVIQEVQDVLSNTADCQLSRMSGSGATCFAIYNTEAEATNAAEAIKAKHADWWLATTTIAGNI